MKKLVKNSSIALVHVGLALSLAAGAVWSPQAPIKEKPTPVSRGGTLVKGVLPKGEGVSPTIDLPDVTPGAPLRERTVKLRVDALDKLGDGTVSQIEFPVFSDKTLLCDVEYIEHTFLEGLAFWGKVVTPHTGHFAGTLYGDHLTVSFKVPDAGNFLLYPIGGGTHAIRHSLPGGPIGCSTVHPKPPAEPQPPKSPAPTEEDGDGAENLLSGTNNVDGVLLYTARYLRWLEDEFSPTSNGNPSWFEDGGGRCGLLMAIAFARLSEAEVNQVLEDSETNMHYTLIGHELWDIDDGPWRDVLVDDEVVTQDGGGIRLFWEQAKYGDGAFELFQEVGEVSGADVVGVFTGILEETGTQGVATTISDPEAFFVDDDGIQIYAASARIIIDGLVVAHELGHNLGCQHDHHTYDNAVDPPEPYEDYSYAHYWTENNHTDEDHDWLQFHGTIMSYVKNFSLTDPWPSEHGDPRGHPDEHIAGGGGTHMHIRVKHPHFSNPDVQVTSSSGSYFVRTGVEGQADNARTIDNTSPHVAAFRTRSNFDSVVWMDPEGGHWSGEEDGTFDYPYDTMLEAVMGVAAGGTIKVKPGSYPRHIAFSKKVNVEVPTGSVLLGDE